MIIVERKTWALTVEYRTFFIGFTLYHRLRKKPDDIIGKWQDTYQLILRSPVSFRKVHFK